LSKLGEKILFGGLRCSQRLVQYSTIKVYRVAH